MRSFSAILFATAFVFSAFSDGEADGTICRVYYPDGNTSKVVVECSPSNSSTGSFFGPEECEDIKQELIGIINGVLDNVRSAKTEVSRAQAENIALGNSITSYGQYVQTLQPDIPLTYYEELHDYYVEMNLAQSRMSTSLSQAYDDVSSAEGSCLSAVDQISGVSCASAGSDCTTGPNGTSCPCQTELNDILDEVRPINTNVQAIAMQVGAIHGLVSTVADDISNMTANVEFITSRLKAPDDRMWDELQDIFSAMTNRYTTYGIATNGLNFSELFYQIKNLINDHEGTGNPLNLSTEGLMSLYSVAYQAAGFDLQRSSFLSSIDAIKYFSNTVSKLFLDYKNLTDMARGGPKAMPSVAQRPFIYNAMTNTSNDFYTRWRDLWYTSNGGQTNWFTRMELYQQALLGWFENASIPEEIDKEQNLSESSILERLESTTNRLGVITSGASSATGSVQEVFASVPLALSEVRINVSLPQTIELFPEIDIGSFGEIGPFYIETEEIAEYCDVARNVTTLIWKVSFWVMWVGLAVGCVRVVFLLVLYAIHFYQNL